VIVGAKKPEQLTDNLAATQVTLTHAELTSLDEISRLLAEYPGWMFECQSAAASKCSTRFDSAIARPPRN
jgi:hypothetical protein